MAAEGYAEAQNRLGALYREGLGVQQDDKEAYSWFGKSAAQGDPQGCCQLAEMSLLGLGCEVNEAKALELFR